MRSRQRNPRGEGSRLREEIVDAAVRLIDAGGPERVTLRGVAREAGISAPSIYDHFTDRAEILGAAKLRLLGQLQDHIQVVTDQYEESVQRLVSGCDAYVGFSARWPARYAFLFAYEPASNAVDDEGPLPPEANPFEGLVQAISDCVQAGTSMSTDPRADATAVWSALHGYATLHSAVPGFPWPERDDLLSRIVRGLARIVD